MLAQAMLTSSLMIGIEPWELTSAQTGPEVFYGFIQCMSTLINNLQNGMGGVWGAIHATVIKIEDR